MTQFFKFDITEEDWTKLRVHHKYGIGYVRPLSDPVGTKKSWLYEWAPLSKREPRFKEVYDIFAKFTDDELQLFYRAYLWTYTMTNAYVVEHIGDSPTWTYTMTNAYVVEHIGDSPTWTFPNNWKHELVYRYITQTLTVPPMEPGDEEEGEE